MATPFQDLAGQIASGMLHVQVGRVFQLDDIVEAHRCMEENRAGGNYSIGNGNCVSASWHGSKE